MRQYVFALGYIACYAPFAYLIHRSGVSSLAVLPSTSLACFACLWSVILISELAARGTDNPDWSLVRRLRWGPPVIAGAASAAILLSATAAYALPVAVVLTSTLMKAGVLTEAPLLDLVRGRTPSPRAVLAMGLAVGAIIVAAAPRIGNIALPAASLACPAIYLAGYAVKLTCAEVLKKERPSMSQVDFAITSLTCAVTFALMAVMVGSLFSEDMRFGWDKLGRFDLVLAGILSQGTGAFSTLILIAPAAHIGTVTLNRAAGVLAGAGATVLSGRVLSVSEIIGVLLIVVAVAILPTPVSVPRKGGSIVRNQVLAAAAVILLTVTYLCGNLQCRTCYP